MPWQTKLALTVVGFLTIGPMVVMAFYSLMRMEPAPTLSDTASAAGWQPICTEWRPRPGAVYQRHCTDTVWFCPDECRPVPGLPTVRLEPA